MNLYFSTKNESYLDYEPFLLSFCDFFQTFCDSVHKQNYTTKIIKIKNCIALLVGAGFHEFIEMW